MKINNISFITPLINEERFVIEKEYSEKLTLLDGSSINLASNIGPRENQQDSIAVAQNKEYLLLLVADGMGGLKKGEEASYKVAALMKKWLESREEELKHLTKKSLEKTIARIVELAQLKIMPDNAGTTLNMSIIGPENTLIVNIGDSRTYSIKDKQITMQSTDDSLAFWNFDTSKVEYRDILRFYKDNNLITNCIDKKSTPVVNVKIIKNTDYDILCHVTDGVSDILSENQIREHSLSESPAVSLVESAISSGPIYNPYYMNNFYKYIAPKDNASAVVYTKKRTL